MLHYDVIKQSVITEKTQRDELNGVYTVIVDPRATKVDVRSAFVRLYGVTVEKVNIAKVRVKFRNTKMGVLPKRKEKKKAIVTLKKGERIDDFSKIVK